MTPASASAATERAAVPATGSLGEKAGALEPRPVSERHEHQSLYEATAGSRQRRQTFDFDEASHTLRRNLTHVNHDRCRVAISKVPTCATLLLRALT